MTEQVGRVKAINVYPLEGAGPTSYNQAVVDKDGLLDDGEWLLYDLATFKQVGQGQAPQLAQLIATPDEKGRLHVVRDPSLEVSGWETVVPAIGEISLTGFVIIESDGSIPCYDMGDKTAGAFSELLNREVRMARKVRGEDKSLVDHANATLRIGLRETVNALAYAAYGRMPDKPADLTRANILVGGFPAFSDAEWTGGTLMVGRAQIAVDEPTKHRLPPGDNQRIGQNLKDRVQVYKLTTKPADDDRSSTGVYGHFAGDEPVIIKVGDRVRFVPAGERA